jgi:hypothetical protein
MYGSAMSGQPTRKIYRASVAKADSELGLVFGFGITCWKRDEKTGILKPYYDVQDEHIPEPVMLKGIGDFAMYGSVMDSMHDESRIGIIQYSFPMTRDIMKSLGFEKGKEYGWAVAGKPDKRSDLKKFLSGEWTGFSIGGFARAKAHDETLCPECSAKLGPGNCEHQPEDA